MKSTDKYLLGIVTGIILLIVIAFVVTISRPEETFLPEDSPENVTHNYLLSLQKKDYERAYGYLSPKLPGYPLTAEEFAEDIQDYSWQFRNDQGVSLSIESASVTDSRANVIVLESRFYSRGVFDSSQDITTFDVTLRREEGEWKIIDGEHYFIWCWSSTDRCR